MKYELKLFTAIDVKRLTFSIESYFYGFVSVLQTTQYHFGDSVIIIQSYLIYMV